MEDYDEDIMNDGMEDIIQGFNNINVTKYTLTTVEQIEFQADWIIRELQDIQTSYFDKNRLNLLQQRMQLVENAWKNLIQTENMNVIFPLESHKPILKKIVYYVFNILLVRMSNLTYKVLDEKSMHIIMSDSLLMSCIKRNIDSLFESEIVTVAECLFKIY